MKTYTIPYQYTIIGTATVVANSLEEAVSFIEYNAPCPEPQDQLVEDDQIKKVVFSYLDESFEIHEEDLDIVNDLN
jgi:hypothetical protein